MILVDLVTADDLVSYPKPDALIEDHIFEQEAVCLYGPANCGKTFLALDWALSIATGLPWLGQYAVKRGPVIYMAGEGAASVQVRVKAWMEFHGVRELPGVYFQLRPLNIRDDDTIAEIQHALDTYAEEEAGSADDAAKIFPRLVVVDTLSQFMMGGDENGPDMALFVSNMRQLSQDQQTAVLIVHHTNKGGENERGHTALRGNVDQMFKCSSIYRNGQLYGMEVTNDKARDKERAKPVTMRMRPVADALVPVLGLSDRGTLPEVPKDLLDLLKAVFQLEDENSEKTRHRDIMEYTGQPSSSVHRRLSKLAGLKLIKYREGKSALTTLGRAVLDAEGIKRDEKEDS